MDGREFRLNPPIDAHIQNPHDFSGFWPLIRIGDFAFPTYYVVVSIACCVCILWLVKRCDRRALSRTTAIDLALAIMIFGFIGARMFHVFFEEPAYYLEAPSRVLEFWQGGFVWYGGSLLGAGAALFLLWKRKLPFFTWLDVLAPVIALGYALGRVACLFTGCCYGDVCMLFPSFPFRHPTQIYAIVTESLAIAILLWLERSRRMGSGPSWARPPGRIFLAWLAMHSVGRILMEAFRGDPRGPAPLGLSISTWISSILLMAALAPFFLRKKSRV